LEQTFRPNKLVSLTGELRAYCRVAGLVGEAVVMVSPATWRREILGLTRDPDLKGRAIEWAKAKYPGFPLRQGPRSKTDWADGAEALCLAEYGLRLLQRKPDARALTRG